MLNYWGDLTLDRTFAWMDELRRRMDTWAGDFDTAQTFTGARMTIRDEGKELTLIAEVPGVGQENLKVSLHNDTLTISGERADDLPQGYKVSRRERSPIRFSRTFTLPVKVDPDKTRAELKNGVLKLTLEKAAEAQPRQISVKAA